MSERIRGRRLQEIRRNHFREHPLSAHCIQEGRTTLATELDHIVALVNGGEDVESNRQGLCVEHHLRKTAQDLGTKYKPTIGLDGWPEK